MGKAYKGVTVAAARKIAVEFDKDMVIILAYDAIHAMTHTTTYGKSAEDKEAAAMLGEQLTAACNVDMTKKEIHADFHEEQPDHPVQIEECEEAFVTLIISFPNHSRRDEVVDEGFEALHRLDFIDETGLGQNCSYTVKVKARSVAELHRLLPAYKARIRDVLTGVPVCEKRL